MDKKTTAEHLALAERHVAEGQQRIERQRAFIRALKRGGGGPDLVTANGLLGRFEELQALHIEDRDRLRQELKKL